MKQKQEGRLSAALKKTNNYHRKPRRSRHFVNKEIVLEGLRRNVEAVCLHLLPNGKRVGNTWRVGNIAGEPGSSLSVVLTGPKAGAWQDFATNEKGDLLALWMVVKGLTFHEALIDAAQWLGMPAQRGGIPHARPLKRPAAPSAKAERHSGASGELIHHDCPDWPILEKGTERDIQQLHRTLTIGCDGIDLARKRGLLWFFTSKLGRIWCITDSYRFVRQDRLLNGKPISLRNKSEAPSRTRGNAFWPVGAADIGDKPVVIFCEGSSDSLAAHQLISCHSREKDTAVVAMLGASQSIHEVSLPHFRDRTVIIFPDYDSAGIAAAVRWKEQLETAGASVTLFDFVGLFRDDGQPVNDLRDFLRVDADHWHNDSDPCVKWSIPVPVKRGGEPC